MNDLGFSKLFLLKLLFFGAPLVLWFYREEWQEPNKGPFFFAMMVSMAVCTLSGVVSLPLFYFAQQQWAFHLLAIYFAPQAIAIVGLLLLWGLIVLCESDEDRLVE